MPKRKYEEHTSDLSSTENEYYQSSQSYMADTQSDVPVDLPSAADIYLESSVPENIEIEDESEDQNIELPFNKEIMKNVNYKLKIKKLFVKFLNNYDNKKYTKLIKRMCAENKENIYVSYTDMENFDDLLVKVLVICAEPVLVVFDDSLKTVALSIFPNYFMIKLQAHVRIIEIPVIEELRELRNESLGCLIRIKGIVTRRSGVFPRIFLAKYFCVKCKCTFGPFLIENENDFRPANCVECQNKGPFLINEKETLYKDFQKITLQEIPGTVPAGTLSRSKDVLVFL